jgi:hypothetical protein
VEKGRKRGGEREEFGWVWLYGGMRECLGYNDVSGKSWLMLALMAVMVMMLLMCRMLQLLCIPSPGTEYAAPSGRGYLSTHSSRACPLSLVTATPYSEAWEETIVRIYAVIDGWFLY